MATKTKSKAKVVEVEEVEAPKAKAEKIEHGAAWLAELINEKQGTSIDAYRVRVLLRKLTKDGVLSRTEADARSRYNWPKGEKDPEVKAILAAVKGGALERATKERLEGLKEANASKKGKKAAAVEEEAPAKASKAKVAPAKGKATTKSAPAKATKGKGKKAAAADLDMDDI